MHEPVIGHLEEYLDGDGPFPDVEAHLSNCETCRKELDGMRALRRGMEMLRAPTGIEPSVSFYAAVMNRIETQARPSVWALFADSLFAQRLTYASAAFIILLGTFLVSSATDPAQSVAASTPAVILAGDNDDTPPTIAVQPEDRGAVLVNLVGYQQVVDRPSSDFQ
jgi:predicted anti-sigma-YlaC factor YlaD